MGENKMPFDSKGNFTRLHSWEQDRIDDIDIVTDHHDAEDDGFADAFNECFLRSGTVPMEGQIDAGGFKLVGLADGYAEKDAVNIKQLKEKETTIKDFLNLLVAVGDIKPSVLPANHGNWLLCNGQAISRTDYADLFAIVGTNFGNGNGVTTFNVPDYRGKFLRGLGGSSAANMQTTQSDAMQGHTHNYNFKSTIGGSLAGKDPNSVTNVMIKATPPVEDGYGIPRVANETRPLNQAVNYFIKAKKEA